ncbi:MAG: hypothetical protein ACREHG_03745 [Candidatus Saccharimonadales bacterium]
MKIITLLIIGAIVVLIVTHPAGAAGGMVAGGSVLNKTLALESGQGIHSGVAGSVNANTGQLTFAA